MVKIKCSDLRTKSQADLSKQFEDLKNELLALRVAKITGKAPSKLSKIRVVNKEISRVYNVIHQKQKECLRKAYLNKKSRQGLKQKRTRGIRKTLSPRDANRKTLKAIWKY